MPLRAGQLLNNRYRIVKLIGKGGFGAVYRAWDMSLRQPCALKENLDTSPEARAQFEREAIILAELRHPNLPRVTDHFFIADQGQYLVMDFVDGRNIENLLLDQDAPVDEETALEWAQQICDALKYMHSQNPPVIHRDIKPQNIIINRSGRAMLVDFGISKIFDANMSTAAGAKGVTPGFSPPEQYGIGRTDKRSDIYAFGATLYYALSGQVPPDAIERLVRHEPLIDLKRLNPRVSSVTARAIYGAMQLEPDQRYPVIPEFMSDLEGALFSPAAPARVSAVGVPNRLPQPQVIPQKPAPSPPQVEPVVSVKHKQRPRAVTVVAWFCIISSILLILGVITIILTAFGLPGGIMMLRGNLWGRRLSLIYLWLSGGASLVLMIIAIGQGDISAIVMGLFILLVICLVGIRSLNRIDVKDYFSE